MWVAIVLACSTQLATSCQVLANKSQLHYEESICMVDSSKMASYLADAGVYAVPLCIKVGKST